MVERKISEIITAGDTALGIELGSTRIKVALISMNLQTIATGSFEWTSQFQNGNWTYALDDVWKGIQSAYRDLGSKVERQYHVTITKIQTIGVSAMMHGYLPFDQRGNLLVPFRTWRNNSTQAAAKALSRIFDVNIPQRWSIAHLYQAILNHEDHVSQLDFVTTLAGYVHWQLSGKKVLGIGDASGMFPISEQTKTYREDLVDRFEKLPSVSDYPWQLKQILPKPLVAGKRAGTLSEVEAKLIDPTNALQAGSFMAPPEGDAGTGMVSTNSVRVGTGNISVGTSAFAMIVLKQLPTSPSDDIDIVKTPDGANVAMVHANNCTSDLNAWMSLLSDVVEVAGHSLSDDQLYSALLNTIADSEPDAGTLVNFANVSGENITQVVEGRPLFVRRPTSHFNLPNFMLSQLYASFAPLAIGMNAIDESDRQVKQLVAQGGLFRTPLIAQQVLADVLSLPITIQAQASEGGPWGMAVLAIYANRYADQLSLIEYLDQIVFAEVARQTLRPDPKRVAGFKSFLQHYQDGLPLARMAGNVI